MWCRRLSVALDCAGSRCRAAHYDHRRTTCGDGRCPSIRRRFSVGSRAEIFDRIRRQSRMHTCLDQYNTNKTGTGNGGLKWIQKGGGYYSECNKRLKG
jgi:hypothetical protein